MNIVNGFCALYMNQDLNYDLKKAKHQEAASQCASTSTLKVKLATQVNSQLGNKSTTKRKIIENTMGKKKNKNSTQEDIPLKNRYEPLSDKEEEDSESDTSEMDTTPENVKNKSKIIPIIVDVSTLGTENTKNLINKIKKITPELNMKYTPSKLTIYSSNEANFKIIIEFLERIKLSYHTYSRKENMQKKFVIKGLPPMDINELTNSLAAQGAIPTKLAKMKRPKKYAESEEDFATYYLAVSQETDTSAIFKIKFICGLRVRIEKYKNPKQVTQCYNCQRFGHGTSHCHLKPRCVKCSEEHSAKDCNKKPEEKLKCANCQGEHPANYSKCQAYITHLQNIEKRREETKTTKIPTRPNFNQRHFPTLPTKQFEPQTTAVNNTGNLTYSTILKSNPITDNLKENLEDLNELIKELNTLNQMCNIKAMLLMIKNLNIKMKQATTNSEKFAATYEFLTQINDGQN